MDIAQAQNEIYKFSIDFEAKFGAKVAVTILSTPNDTPRLSLTQLEDVINPHCPFDTTLRTKNRFRELVLLGQLFYKFAMDMGYGSYQAAVHLGFTHATAIHSRRNISDKLDIGDKSVTIFHNIIQKEIQEKINNEQLVLTNSKQGTDAESGVSAKLNEAGASDKADQYPCRNTEPYCRPVGNGG